MRRAATAFCLALLRVGFTKLSKSPPILVSSYLTVSPLPRKRLQTNVPFGRMLSVALSLILRPVGITDHPALRSPDFPLANKFASDHLTSVFQFRACSMKWKYSDFHYLHLTWHTENYLVPNAAPISFTIDPPSFGLTTSRSPSSNA